MQRILSRIPEWAWVAALALLALAVRLIHVRQVHALSLIAPVELDPGFYFEWGRTIAAGDWLGTDTFVQSPLYAYLLGVFLSLFGESIIWILIVQSVAGCGTVLLVYWAGRRLFGHAHGLLAGCAIALYAPFIFYEGMVMKTFLSPFLTILLVIIFDVAREAGSPLGDGRASRWLLLAGIVYGVTALDRDNFILLAPVLAGLALVLGGGLSRSGLRSAAAFILGAVIVIGPITIRNWKVSGEFVLLTTGGGEVFFIGNNEYANGLYVPPPFVRPDPKYEHADFVARASEISGRPLTPMQSSWFWFREGMTFIVTQPFAWIRLLGLKMMHFWNYYELPDNLNYDIVRRFAPLLESLNARFPPAPAPTLAFPYGGGWITSRIHLFSTFGTIAPLGLAGLVLTHRRWRRLLPSYVLLFGYVATVLLFFNFSRFRVPIVPILALLAAPALFALGRFLNRLWSLATVVAAGSGAIGARARALCPDASRRVAAGLFPLLLVGVNFELPQGVVPAVEHTLVVGNTYYHLGEPDRALQNYEIGARLLGEEPSWMPRDEAFLARTFGEDVSREDLQRELQVEGLARGPQFKGIRIGIQHGIGIALLLKAERHMARGERTRAIPMIDQAIGQFDSVLKMAPSYLITIRKMAQAYALRGDHASATEWYRKGVDLWPDDLPTRLELAKALFDGGDPHASLREIDQALASEGSLDPKVAAQVYYNRGVLFLNGLSEPGRALFAFEKALALDPTLPQGGETRAMTIELRARGLQPLDDFSSTGSGRRTPP